MAIALRLANGNLTQFQTGEALQADSFERLAGSGNLLVGSALGIAELRLGSTTGLTRLMGDLTFDDATAVIDVGAGGITIGASVTNFLDGIFLDAVNVNGPALAAYDLNASGTNAGAYAIGVDPSLLSTSTATDLMTVLDDIDAAAAGGSGDFSGPASSVTGNIVSFADTTGKLGVDSGVSASAVGSHIVSTSNPHATDLGNLGSGTLTELNTAVTDATLIANTRTLTAGTGLTGGGDLSANRTFDVVANIDGSITVNADDVQVGVLATDAQHGVRGGGTQHALVVAAGAAGFMSGADKTSFNLGLFGAYQRGNNVGVTTVNGTIDFANTTDTTDVLRVSRASAGLGDGLVISMQAGTTGSGINALSVLGASGTLVLIDNLGSGNALQVQDGSSNVFVIDGAGEVNITPTSGQSFNVNTSGVSGVGIVGNNAVDLDSTTGDVTLGTAGVPRITVTNAGAITLASAPGAASAPGEPINILGGLAGTSALGAPILIQSGGSNTNGFPTGIVTIKSANAGGSFNSSGAVAILTGNSVGSASPGILTLGGAVGGNTGPGGRTDVVGGPAGALSNAVGGSVNVLGGLGGTGAGGGPGGPVLVAGGPGGGTDGGGGLLTLRGGFGTGTGVDGEVHLAVLGVITQVLGDLVVDGTATVAGTPVVVETRTLTAGAGLTGGGDLSADRTFDVVANADGSMVVNTDDLQVGVLATDAQHGVRGGGTQHADAIAAGASGFMTGADKTKLDALLESEYQTTGVLFDGTNPTRFLHSAGAGVFETPTGATITIPAGAPTGTYEISVDFEWGYNTATSNFLSQVLQSGVGTPIMEHEEEPADSGGSGGVVDGAEMVMHMGRSRTISFTTGVAVTFTFQFAPAATANCAVRRLELTTKRVV